MKPLSKFFRQVAVLLTLVLASQAHATLVYNSWTSNDALTGNYILSISQVGNQFSYNLTIEPWNAEALGLFIDLGNVNVSNVNLTNTNASAPVALFATNTSTNSCGSGCNLNGLTLPALAGGDWELVFKLGNTGFDGVQTFTWMTSDFGLTEAAFGLVGVRAQQLCSGSDTLPSNISSCNGSDKAYGYASTPTTPSQRVPEPNALALIALALLALGLARRSKQS